MFIILFSVEPSLSTLSNEREKDLFELPDTHLTAQLANEDNE